MIKVIFAILMIAIPFVSPGSIAMPAGSCLFAHKDYDSPGFSLPARKGLSIKSRFGCVYVCDCQGQEYKITHVLEDSYFDIEVLTRDTGGAKRAKWFICPRSVKPDSWKPQYDIYGTLMYFDVEPEDRPFTAVKSGIKEIQNFCK